MSLSGELMTEEQKMIRGFRGVGAKGSMVMPPF